MAAGSTGKAAADLKKKVVQMRDELEKCCGFTERELQFLWDAFRTVIHMKRMLKWSWVFLFFRPESDNDSERVRSVRARSARISIITSNHEISIISLKSRNINHITTLEYYKNLTRASRSNTRYSLTIREVNLSSCVICFTRSSIRSRRRTRNCSIRFFLLTRRRETNFGMEGICNQSVYSDQQIQERVLRVLL